MAQTINNLSQTWNAAGTTFTAIKFNVTNTASAAGSLLMDLQVNGSSKFRVLDIAGLTVYAGGIGDSNARTLLANITGLATHQAASIGWGSPYSQGVNACGGSRDLELHRDAAGTLAQRNGTNAQTFRLYGTYTDASNYRRLVQTMSSGGVAEIKPDGAGTGASGNVLHISGLPTSNPGAGILWNNGGVVEVGT
jgi:hypothetical protein